MRILLALVLGCSLSLVAYMLPALAEKAKVNQSETLSNSVQKKADSVTEGTIRNIGRRVPSQTTGAATGNPRPTSTKTK